jgi:hypothetical protein
VMCWCCLPCLRRCVSLLVYCTCIVIGLLSRDNRRVHTYLMSAHIFNGAAAASRVISGSSLVNVPEIMRVLCNNIKTWLQGQTSLGGGCQQQMYTQKYQEVQGCDLYKLWSFTLDFTLLCGPMLSPRYLISSHLINPANPKLQALIRSCLLLAIQCVVC